MKNNDNVDRNEKMTISVQLRRYTKSCHVFLWC